MVRRWLLATVVGGIVLVAAGCDTALLTSLLGSTTAEATPPGEIITISEFRFDGSEADARGSAVFEGDAGLIQYASDRNGTADSALLLSDGGSELVYRLADPSSIAVRTVSFWLGGVDTVEDIDCEVLLFDRSLLSADFAYEWRTQTPLHDLAYFVTALSGFAESLAFQSETTGGVVATPRLGTFDPGDANWIHFAIVLDAARILRVYVDGDLRFSSNIAAVTVPASEDLALVLIGRDSAVIDDLVLIGTPLGPDDVAALSAGDLDLP